MKNAQSGFAKLLIALLVASTLPIAPVTAVQKSGVGQKKLIRQKRTVTQKRLDKQEPRQNNFLVEPTIAEHHPITPEEQEQLDRNQIGCMLNAYFGYLDEQNSLLIRGQGPFNLDNYQQDGLDLYVRQLDRWQWQEIQSLPEPRYRPLNVQAQTEARNLLMYCDFANANKALGRLLSTIVDQDFQNSYGDFDYDRLWPFLVEADGSDTTLQIFDKLIARALSTQNQSIRHEGDTALAQKLLTHQLTLLEQQNNPKMYATADRLYQIRARSRYFSSYYNQSLGSFFARHGQYVKAKQCLSEALQNNQKSDAKYPHSSMPYWIAYDYYKLSEIAQKTGKIAESIQLAKQSKDILLKTKSPQTESTEPDQPQIPTVAEIDGHIARLTNTKGADKLPRYVERLESDQRTWYKLFHQLDQAIDDADWPTAEIATEKLIVLFDKHGRTQLGRYHLTWGDSFLQMARRLSDKKQLALSNKILNKLNDTMLKNRWQLMARPFVMAELAINKKRAGINPDYEALYQSMHMVEADIDKLRWIALLYAGAGYQERALLYFDQALALPSASQTSGTQTITEEETAKIILLLDAATCYATGGDFTRAQDLAKQAVAQVIQSRIDRSEVHWSVYRRSFQCKLLNYARVMITAKRYSEIESLLIAIQGREKQLTNKAGTAAKAGITAEIGTAAKTENSTENAAIDSKLDCTDILVDATLGEVYYKSGRSALALPLLKKAANLYQQSTYYAPLGLYLLYANCAAECGDFSDAAIAYKDVANAAPDEPWRAAYNNSDVMLRYLHKAIDCANKVDNFDPAQRQKILVMLASLTSDEDADNKLDILMSIYTLIPESDPQKLEIARGISSLAGYNQFKRPENKQAAAKLQSDMLSQIAKLTQLQNPTYAYLQWLELAKVEARENRWSEAKKHFLEAIEGCNKDNNCMTYRRPFITHWDVTTHPIDLGTADDTAYKRGKEILIAASNKIKQLYADRLTNISLQDSQILLYDLRHRRYQDATTELKQLLSANLLNYYDAQEDSANGVEEVIKEIGYLDDSYTDIALKLLNQILDAQKRDLADNDIHFAATYMAIGKAYKTAKRYPEALEMYQKAIALTDLYGQYHNNDAASGMAEILRKQGNEEAADDAERIVAPTEMPNRVMISEQGTIEPNNLSLALSEYHMIASKYPYSSRCDALLDVLIKLTRDSKDTDLLISLLKARLEIAKRISYQRNDIFTQTKLGIGLDLYRQIVSAYIKNGDVVTAQKYAAESLQNIYRTRDLALLTALAKVQLAAGNRDITTRLAQEATDLPIEKLKAYPGSDDLQEIWQDLGDTAKAEKLKALTGG